MGKNIVIAFVSIFGYSFDINKEPDAYKYGKEDKFVTGRQTNEAPLKYLLTEYKDIDQIICLVSDLAGKAPDETKREKHGNQSPYDYLTGQIALFEGAQGKENLFDRVDYKETEKDYFTRTIIPEILQRIHPGDTIFLETSGGQRNNVTQMMLLARILTYQGTKLKCAVYSDFFSKEKEIYDVTDSFRDFDLVNGLNEFGSTGATGMLESYFKDTVASSKTVVELVQAMKELNETIILGRISKIQNKTDNMKKKLESAKNELDTQKDNPILAVLLPIFRNKYEQLSSTPELIKWCAANNLIQLAFTLYSDWLPHYIMEDAKIISCIAPLSDKDKERIKDKKTNPSAYRLNAYFLFQAQWETSSEDGYVRVLKNLSQLIKQSRNGKGRYRYKKGIRPSEIEKMLQDFAYAKTLRNEINHALANETDSETSITDDERIQDRKDYLSNQGYVFDEDKLDIDTLKQFLTDSMNRILELAKRK